MPDKLSQSTALHPDEALNVIAADGFLIRGDIWHGDGGPVVIIHSALAFRQAITHALPIGWRGRAQR